MNLIVILTRKKYWASMLLILITLSIHCSSHLCQACQHIPAHIKMELRKLRVRRDNASGGKQYWADGCRALGIYEDGTCLRLEKKSQESGEAQDAAA